MLKRLLLVAAGLMVAGAALLFVRGRLNAPPPNPDAPANTFNASWRGFDSGYRHPATRAAEDANAYPR